MLLRFHRDRLTADFEPQVEADGPREDESEEGHDDGAEADGEAAEEDLALEKVRT